MLIIFAPPGAYHIIIMPTGTHQELEAVRDECIHDSNVLQLNLFSRRNCECRAATYSFIQHNYECRAAIHSFSQRNHECRTAIHSFDGTIVDAALQFITIIPNAIIISHVPHDD